MKILSSKVIYADSFVQVIQDTCQNGAHTAVFTYLKRPSNGTRIASVVIIPVTGTGLVFVKQYRVANRDYFWQLPGGFIEKGEDIFSAAQKELREEVGLHANTLEIVGSAVLEPGAVAQTNAFVCAKNLTKIPAQREDPEEIIEVREIPFQTVDTMIETGEILCGFTLVGILFLKQKGIWHVT